MYSHGSLVPCILIVPWFLVFSKFLGSWYSHSSLVPSFSWVLDTIRITVFLLIFWFLLFSWCFGFPFFLFICYTWVFIKIIINFMKCNISKASFMSSSVAVINSLKWRISFYYFQPLINSSWINWFQLLLKFGYIERYYPRLDTTNIFYSSFSPGSLVSASSPRCPLPVEKNIWKNQNKKILKKNLQFFIAYNIPRHKWVSTKNFSPIGPAVWPAIYIYECLVLLYR